MSTDPETQSKTARKNRVRPRMPWWRTYEGFANHPRWRQVSRRTKRPLPEVVTTVTCLCGHASSAEERGSVADFDAEVCGSGVDIETEHVQAIVAALEATGWIADGRIVSWDDRQTASDDPGARDRKRRQRERERETKPVTSPERDVTLRHGDVTANHGRGEETRAEREQDHFEAPSANVAELPGRHEWTDADWPEQGRRWATVEPMCDDSDETVAAYAEAEERYRANPSPSNVIAFGEARNRLYAGRWPHGQSAPTKPTYYDVVTGDLIAA